MIGLVLGGEKSGKSALAYDRFAALAGPRRVLAMGQAQDQAFRAQILAHRQARDPALPLEEPGLDLAGSLTRAARSGTGVLVDSVDFWVFRCLEQGLDRLDELEAALEGFRSPKAPVCLLVSCEVGLGPLAASSLTRRFARAQGEANQRLASLADEAVLVVAGLPVWLKKGAIHGLF